MGTTDDYLTNYGSSTGFYWTEAIENDYITWFNSHLSKASPPMSITHLTEENMCNGVAIGLLLERVGGIKLNGLLLQPITRVERLHNVHEVFSVLRNMNVRLDNMQPEDVMNGQKSTIIQLLVAISSHLLLDPRARQTPNTDDGQRRSGSVSPRAHSRHTPTDLYTPSAHFTEILDSSYSHQIIGPTVYSGETSGHSSPRSRSTMTMMFSGKRSPAAPKRFLSNPNSPSPRISFRDPSLNKISMTPPPPTTPSHNKNSPIYSGQSTSSSPHNRLNTGQSAPELARYADPLNELSKMKTQLNTIQRLHDGYMSGLQTDETDIEQELNYAKQQIIELTRMLQAKDVVLRKTEQENIRLNETVRRLRDAERQRPASETNATCSYPSVLKNSSRMYTSNTRLNPSLSPSTSARNSTTRFLSEHSYDPRVNSFQGFKPIPHMNPSILKKYADNELDGDVDESYQSEPRRARSRNDSIHVKKVSLNLDSTPGPAYLDNSDTTF
ncbi:Dixin [Fasciola gigantica]|uniref:Dixin n=1 Tax=Fasciola gigantica TaxID=46835 RepID=A0A504X0F5_FASGI|nr:Dixin [Fasciola gigantica]